MTQQSSPLVTLAAEGVGAGAPGDQPVPVVMDTLPRGHELRCAKLLGAQCRNRFSKDWRTIGASWGIAGASYDQLTEAWTAATEFRRA